MQSPYLIAGLALWVVWILSWHVAGLWRNEPVATAKKNTWRGFIVIAALGFVMLFGEWRLLSRPLWQPIPVVGWGMVVLIAASFAAAWWARVTMGRMWSGGVGRTENHSVIQSGPFAWVRHPIYTTLITAALALAVIKATPMGFAGVALIALGFGLKARVEERFLTEELPAYAEYRARVPMLVPMPPPRKRAVRNPV